MGELDGKVAFISGAAKIDKADFDDVIKMLDDIAK